MRRLTLSLGLLLGATGLFGQHAPLINPSRGVGAPPNAYRYGNILYPGGTPTHAQRLGATVAGNPYGGPSYSGVGGGRPNMPGHHGRPGGQTIVVPYAVPVFYDAGYYGYQQVQQVPNITVVVPQQPSPSVIINHNYSAPEVAKPVMREYSAGGLGETEAQVQETPKTVPQKLRSPANDKPTIYLISLKDSTIRSAIGFWVEDQTLHYVTPQGSVNRITLDMVDQEASEQLNSERNLEFKLQTGK